MNRVHLGNNPQPLRPHAKIAQLVGQALEDYAGLLVCQVNSLTWQRQRVNLAQLGIAVRLASLVRAAVSTMVTTLLVLLAVLFAKTEQLRMQHRLIVSRVKPGTAGKNGTCIRCAAGKEAHTNRTHCVLCRDG